IGAKHAAGKVLLDVFAHAGHDGHYRDEEHDADHHAEQGEEALELLDADLLERESDGFEEGHGRLYGLSREKCQTNALTGGYSYLSASTGSNRAARAAGT